MKRQDKIAVARYQLKLEQARAHPNVNVHESADKQKANKERARKDFAYMVERYFPHYADAATPDFHVKFAKRVKRDPVFKGFAQWGRGLAKSVVSDILLPFWLWINDQPVYMVIVGNSENRAKQLLEDLRAELEVNPQIIRDYGEQHNPGSWEDGFFVAKGGIIGQALGMGQNVRGLRVRGKRPTLLICDDIETKDVVKNPGRQKEIAKWIERHLMPTMDGPVRRVTISATR